MSSLSPSGLDMINREGQGGDGGDGGVGVGGNRASAAEASAVLRVLKSGGPPAVPDFTCAGHDKVKQVKQ